MKENTILVVNAGSSSVKLALYGSSAKGSLAKKAVWKDSIEIGSDRAPPSADGVANAIVHSLKSAVAAGSIPPLSLIVTVGHRVVHGGSQFSSPTVINNQVKGAIKELSALAPLHNPLNLAGISAAEKLLPKAKQIAVFDTAFFSTLPEYASTYPGPYAWVAEGIKRYGFHGTSHHYNMLKCSDLLHTKAEKLKIVSCHLGNGVSLAAIGKGKCLDTTMGFTPLDGLMMGTRSGAIDPGILTYLMTAKGAGPDDLYRLLNYDSGLKGISGTSGDMRDILSSVEKKRARSILAYDMFIHSLVKYIAAMGASLKGIDAIAFSGGIGEHSWQVRRDAAASLEWMGIALDKKANRRCDSDGIITQEGSKVKVVVITTEEDWMIANTCKRLIG